MAFFERSKSRKLTKKGFLTELRSSGVSTAEIVQALNRFEFRIDEIASMLYERNPRLKKFALEALKRNTTEDRLKELFNLLENEPSKSRRELLGGAILLLEDSDTSTYLTRMSNSPIVAKRVAAQGLFRQMPNWNKNRRLAIEFLNDPNEEVVIPMVKSVIEVCPDAYLERIRHLAIHESLRIRTLVLEFLIPLNDPGNIDTFFSRLPYEEGELREALLEAVTKMVESNPEEMLERTLQGMGDGTSEIRTMSVELFARLPNPYHNFTELIVYLSSTTSWMRETMYEELRAVSDDLVEPLLQYLDDPQYELLHHLAFHLATFLGHKRLLPLMTKNWETSNWLRRFEVLKALTRMKSDQALPLLLKAVDQHETSLLAIKALAEYEDVRLSRVFVKKLRSPNQSIQIAALQAMSRLPEPKLVPVLTRLCKHFKEPDLIIEVANTVVAICDATDMETPKEMLELVQFSDAPGLGLLPDMGLKLTQE